MPNLVSNGPLMVGVFLAVTVFLLYIAVKFAQNDPPTPTPTPDSEQAHYTYNTPKGWDGETPLQWCEDCGTFNNAEYQFCQECITHLSTGQLMPPRAISKLQNEVEKQ